MTKFRMYIDEVGNPDMASSDDPNHRYLSLTGIILDLEHVRDMVSPQIEELKRTFFGSHPDDPIILHRKEILNAQPPFEALRDEATRTRFNAELLSLLSCWEYVVCTVCLDKKRHRDTYTVWRYDPYHYCLSILLERYVFYLNRRKSRGDVMAESRGGREDRRLKDSFERLFEYGTDYVDTEQFQNALSSRQLKVKSKSANIAGLQIADLIAHPSRAEILNENNVADRPLAPFALEIVRILQSKYDRCERRVYGKKLI